jgi:hypothetical protein
VIRADRFVGADQITSFVGESPERRGSSNARRTYRLRQSRPCGQSIDGVKAAPVIR